MVFTLAMPSRIGGLELGAEFGRVFDVIGPEVEHLVNPVNHQTQVQGAGPRHG